MNTEKETVVDYQAAVIQFSRGLSLSRDDLISLPEPAKEQVTDYIAISEKLGCSMKKERRSAPSTVCSLGRQNRFL